MLWLLKPCVYNGNVYILAIDVGSRAQNVFSGFIIPVLLR